MPPSSQDSGPDFDTQKAKAALPSLPELRIALESRPRDGNAWRDYIQGLLDAGMADAAGQMLAQAQRHAIDIPHGDALRQRLAHAGSAGLTATFQNLAALFQQSRFVEMELAARALTVQFADNGEAWKAWGIALDAIRRPADALAAMERAATLLPRDGEAHRYLGILLRDAGRLEEAEASSRLATQLNPHAYSAVSGVVRVLHARGKMADAEALCREAVKQHPLVAEAHYDLATLLAQQFRFDEAEAGFRRALELKTDYLAAMNNLGSLLIETGRFAEAETVLHRARQQFPQSTSVLSNLSSALNGQYRHDEADAVLDEAIRIEPVDTAVFSMLLLGLNYTGRRSQDERFELARRYGRAAKVDQPFTRWQCAPSPSRLRVGIVSGDFGNHPVGYFLEAMVAHIDPSRIELFAYPTTHKDDALTARLKPRFAAWHGIAGISDQAAAQRIHDDGVHVLLDISGHTAGNRLPVFAYKPAPVQASWLGYFATTGLDEMDYLLADRSGVSAISTEKFTEQIYYLPETRLCFMPPANAPHISASPAGQNGHITFGCFQNLSKVSDPVLAAWGRIFVALPDARLRMQCRELGFPASRQHLLERLSAQGISPARVTLQGRVGRDAYFSSYGEVDMMLDTFPYPGGTTTCEALWMGVPTVTLAPEGGSLIERQGASLLAAAGLNDWIAGDAKKYVACAIQLASDSHALSALRAGLREKVLASPLFDGKRFAKQFEEALWEMWNAKNQLHKH